ncbi:MAG: dihydropteroate synthase [Dehalococcoidia bacterium]|nr:dihydropteroate synthase [Dehalococcoidia bacterium]
MLVIGEKINASNKSVAAAIAARDVQTIANLAAVQAAKGVDYIDVNAGARHGTGLSGADIIEWLVEIVQETTDLPICIDSDSPEIIEAALRKYRGKTPIINSVTAEPERLSTIGRLAAEHQAILIALAMGDRVIPKTAEERLAACDTLFSSLEKMGIPPERILFDPLVLPVSVDSNQGLVTLKTIKGIKARYPSAGTVMGLSNISYGLPNRPVINRAFLLMAAYAGLDALILDPLDSKIMGLVKVADVLTGKDPSCRGYLKAYRKGDIVD